MPENIAHAYEHLGMELQAFAGVFRPDNGNCFLAMARDVRGLSDPKLHKLRALELLHDIAAAGSMALSRLISWHRQLPAGGVPWLPYLVSDNEARSLSLVADELERLDDAVKTIGWTGPGGGVRFSQQVAALRSIEPGVDLHRFNAGMGTLVIQFTVMALQHP